MTEKPILIHPDIVPDVDPRTVEEIVADHTPVEETSAPVSLLDRLRQQKESSGPTPGPGRRTRAKKTTGGDIPPRRMGSSKSTAFVQGRVKEAFEQTYGQIAMMWGMFDPHCATVLAENASIMADSMERLAENSPVVRRIADQMLTGTSIGAMISAHAPIGLAIYAHHFSPGAKAARAAATANGDEVSSENPPPPYPESQAV